MRRGDLVTIVLSGDYGKPRPALLIQSDVFVADHPSKTVLTLTSALRDDQITRVRVEPTPENGLRIPSDIAVDKIMTVSETKVGSRIGRIDDATMLEVTRRLALFLGIAD